MLQSLLCRHTLERSEVKSTPVPPQASVESTLLCFPPLLSVRDNDNYLICRLGLANEGPAEELLGEAYQQRNRDEDEISKNKVISA